MRVLFRGWEERTSKLMGAANPATEEPVGSDSVAAAKEQARERHCDAHHRVDLTLARSRVDICLEQWDPG